MILSKTDSIQAFFETFAAKSQEIQNEISQYSDNYKSIFAKIMDLEKSFQTACAFLPSYDQRQYTLKLRALKDSLESKKAERDSSSGKPKSAFSFKGISIKKSSQKSSTSSIEKMEPEVTESVDPIVSEFDIRNLENCDNFIREFGLGDKGFVDFTIADCTNSTVRVHGVFNAVRVRNMKSCTIQLGPCKGSVFIEKCSDCKFQVACHQLRIHNVNDCEFGLLLTSKGIIEDCSGIAVKQYDYEYESISKDLEESGLLRLQVNYWNDLQDFNWLRTDVQSPNWKVLLE